MRDNALLYLNGCPVPLTGSRLSVEQPTLHVVAMLGEKNFFEAMKFCQVHKKDYLEQVKEVASDRYDEMYCLDEMEIFFTVAQSSPGLLQQLEIGLNILFPSCDIRVSPGTIIVDDEFITGEMYSEIKEIASASIGLSDSSEKKEFNTKSDRAKEIEEKIKKSREKLEAERKASKGEAQSSISNYISAMAVGLQIPLSTIFNYTLYQLYDQIKRFGRKQASDTALKAMLAGAKDVKTVDWFSSSDDE